MTLSPANTDAIVRELSAKFGRPTSVYKTTSSIAGIDLPAIQTEWDLPNVHVRYLNLNYQVDQGSLEIESNTLRAVRRTHEQMQDRERTKL